MGRLGVMPPGIGSSEGAGAVRAMNAEPIVDVQEAGVLFGNGRGVRNVSFRMAGGEIFGLFGPNGAGKTTLLKMIAGLIRPDRGSIRLFGRSVADRHEQAMAQVGCVIESADAYEYLSAYGNLKLAARFYPELPKSRIDQALEQVGLAPYAREKAGHFSLGMKQRLALAGALLSQPRLVVLDEPTNGLDAEGIVDVRETIRRLAAERQTAFLLSSHMIGDMEKIATRFGILHRGAMIKQGDNREWISAGMTLEQYYLAQIRSANERETGVGTHASFEGELVQ